MKKHIYYIITILVTLLATDLAWGQEDVSGTWAGGSLSGSYKLTGDTRLSATITVATGNVLTIDLNGYVLYGNIPLLIDVDGTLNIVDSNQTKENKGYVDANGLFRWPYSSGKTEIKVKGGVIHNQYYNASTKRQGISISGTCNIKYANIMGCFNATFGAAVSTTSSGKFYMEGGQISYNRTGDNGTRGAVVYGNEPSKNLGSLISISNTTLAHNYSTGQGGAIYGWNIRLNKCDVFSNESKKDGGAFFVHPYSSANLRSKIVVTDTKINNNLSAAKGGGIYAENAVVEIIGSEISNNDIAGNYGGGLYTKDSDVTITNSKINSNEALSAGSYGGGIYTENAVVEIIGSEISNNDIAGNYGGGLYTKDSDVTITNSKINSNEALSAGSYGGGIYVSSEDKSHTLTISNSEINGNYSLAFGGGIYSNIPTTIIDSKINHNRSMASQTTDSNPSTGRGGGFHFTSQIECQLINTEVQENAAMWYGGGGQVDHKAKLTVSGTSKINNNKVVLHGAGGLHLTSDAHLVFEDGEISYNEVHTVGGAIHTSYGCTLELNGGEIRGNVAHQRGGGVHVNTGGDLTLNGTNILDNKVYRGYDMVYSQVIRNTDGTYTWTAPEYTTVSSHPLDSDYKLTDSGYGGGVLIDSGTYTMKKGLLSGNYAEKAGGGLALIMIRMSTSNDFERLKVVQCIVEEGTISGNTTEGNGAGVYLMRNKLKEMFSLLSAEDQVKVKAYSNFDAIMNGVPSATIKNGILSDNSADISGAAIMMEKGNFYINGTASLTKNQSGSHGGGIYIGGGEFTIDGSLTATGNSSTSGSGGAVYLGKGDNANPSVFTVGQNGKLNLGGNNATLGNTAGLNGGGIYCQGAFTVNGTASVQYNNAANGGGVYVDGANAIFTKATSLLNNTSTGNGGAVYVDGGNITLKANTISSNSAANGGAVYLNNGSFSADGNTTMSSNSASGNGGSVYVNGGGIAITGSSSVLTLSGNSANNGGAFYVTGGNITANTISKATISNNYSAASGGAGGEGGAFYVSNGNINMCKTDLSGNGKNGSNITTTNGGAIALYNGVFQFADGSEIKNNAATGNGGGLYVSSSTAQSITCIGGSYLANSSTLGGGIYASGPINLTIAANVRNNTATNGGGLYLTGDVKMTFGYEDSNGVVDGLIVDNTAYGPDGSTDGVGGGIYLDKGTLSFYLPSDKAKQKLGIYNNAASYEAADIYSSGNGTTIVLPNVGDMNLTDFDVPGSTLYWVRDFYDNRYQTALMNLNADIEAMILDFDDATTLTLEDKQCLDLGYDLVYVTITPVNLSESDNAVLVISYPSDRENPNSSSVSQYRKVTLQGGMNAVVGLPSGKWHFDMTEWAAKYRFQEFNPTHVDGFIDITRDALKGTDGVITVTFTVEETKKDIIKYDFIKVNRMVPKVSN